MNKFHLELLKALSEHQLISDNKEEKHKKYIGSNKICYALNTKKKSEIAKNWIKNHPNFSLNEYIDLLNSLYNGKSHTEISIASKILEYSPKLRKSIKPELLNNWLSNAQGWSEVDSICQSNFSSEELLSNWNEWEKIITKFSNNKNIHKKRASLVLLTNPVRKSSDARLSELAFENINKLKKEKDILITKAISWLLRSLITNHRNKLKSYLEKNKNSLPKIAVRETTRKLVTGKK